MSDFCFSGYFSVVGPEIILNMDYIIGSVHEPTQLVEILKIDKISKN
jgi:hypothetical protein